MDFVSADENNPLPVAGEEGPPLRVRDLFGVLFHPHDSHSTDG